MRHILLSAEFGSKQQLLVGDSSYLFPFVGVSFSSAAVLRPSSGLHDIHAQPPRTSGGPGKSRLRQSQFTVSSPLKAGSRRAALTTRCISESIPPRSCICDRAPPCRARTRCKRTSPWPTTSWRSSALRWESPVRWEESWCGVISLVTDHTHVAAGHCGAGEKLIISFSAGPPCSRVRLGPGLVPLRRRVI